MGGKSNYAADRAAAAALLSATPDALLVARSNRNFMGRAIHHLAAEAGIRQFLDIGTGLPTANNTHEVAQAAAPDARIVHVGNDPLVLVHAQALLTSAPEGATHYVEADLKAPETIVHEAATLLDFDQPVAPSLCLVLQYITGDEVTDIVATLKDHLAPGSLGADRPGYRPGVAVAPGTPPSRSSAPGRASQGSRKRGSVRALVGG